MIKFNDDLKQVRNIYEINNVQMAFWPSFIPSLFHFNPNPIQGIG
jgi:hypothetical protein